MFILNLPKGCTSEPLRYQRPHRRTGGPSSQGTWSWSWWWRGSWRGSCPHRGSRWEAPSCRCRAGRQRIRTPGGCRRITQDPSPKAAYALELDKCIPQLNYNVMMCIKKYKFFDSNFQIAWCYHLLYNYGHRLARSRQMSRWLKLFNYRQLLFCTTLYIIPLITSSI